MIGADGIVVLYSTGDVGCTLERIGDLNITGKRVHRAAICVEGHLVGRVIYRPARNVVLVSHAEAVRHVQGAPNLDEVIFDLLLDVNAGFVNVGTPNIRIGVAGV